MMLSGKRKLTIPPKQQRKLLKERSIRASLPNAKDYGCSGWWTNFRDNFWIPCKRFPFNSTTRRHDIFAKSVLSSRRKSYIEGQQSNGFASEMVRNTTVFCARKICCIDNQEKSWLNWFWYVPTIYVHSYWGRERGLDNKLSCLKHTRFSIWKILSKLSLAEKILTSIIYLILSSRKQV